MKEISIKMLDEAVHETFQFSLPQNHDLKKTLILLNLHHLDHHQLRGPEIPHEDTWSWLDIISDQRYMRVWIHLL